MCVVGCVPILLHIDNQYSNLRCFFCCSSFSFSLSLCLIVSLCIAIIQIHFYESYIFPFGLWIFITKHRQTLSFHQILWVFAEWLIEIAEWCGWGQREKKRNFSAQYKWEKWSKTFQKCERTKLQYSTSKQLFEKPTRIQQLLKSNIRLWKKSSPFQIKIVSKEKETPFHGKCPN